MKLKPDSIIEQLVPEPSGRLARRAGQRGARAGGAPPNRVDARGVDVGPVENGEFRDVEAAAGDRRRRPGHAQRSGRHEKRTAERAGDLDLGAVVEVRRAGFDELD